VIDGVFLKTFIAERRAFLTGLALESYALDGGAADFASLVSATEPEMHTIHGLLWLRFAHIL
jgi:hypothetical protein